MTEAKKNGKKSRKPATNAAKANGKKKSKDSIEKEATELMLKPLNHENHSNSNNVKSHGKLRRHSHEERLSLRKVDDDDVIADFEAQREQTNRRSRCICIAASIVLVLIFSGELNVKLVLQISTYSSRVWGAQRVL